jgi:hypothetical protein
MVGTLELMEKAGVRAEDPGRTIYITASLADAGSSNYYEAYSISFSSYRNDNAA